MPLPASSSRLAAPTASRSPRGWRNGACYLALCALAMGAAAFLLVLGGLPSEPANNRPTSSGDTGALPRRLVSAPVGSASPAQLSNSAQLATAMRAAAEHRARDGIPALIHQVHGLFDAAAPAPHLQQSIDSFRRLNPSATHVLWGPAELDAFVRQAWPALWPVYRSLPLPVLKADWARYLLAFTFGGVYSDADTICRRPISEWTGGADNVSMIVGVEINAPDISDWHKHWGRRLQICQWTFAAAPGHPILAHALHRSLQQLRAQPSLGSVTREMVTAITGPSVFTDAVFDVLQSMDGGSEKRVMHALGRGQSIQIGDVLVLGITAFSPGVGHRGDEGLLSHKALVQHLFDGRWKPPPPAPPRPAATAATLV